MLIVPVRSVMSRRRRNDADADDTGDDEDAGEEEEEKKSRFTALYLSDNSSIFLKGLMNKTG